VLILAHRKELLEQTGEKISCPINYYSAAMGDKSPLTDSGITVASVQSLARVKELPKYDVIIIDECHLMPNDNDQGQYWSIINRNNGALLIGLTATPWRTQGGSLSWGNIVYSIGYDTLMAADFLTPLSNKLLKDVTPNLESVEIKLGEYVQNQISRIMEDEELVAASVRAILHYGQGRESCLIFTVSVNHAYLIAQAMLANVELFPGGIEVITGETLQDERDAMVDNFREGRIRFLINCEILLVGFDAPRVDAIFCLRPTKSKVLWEQMCGRGVRKFPGKLNCLLVDMAGNLREHGGLGTPFKEKKRGESPKESGRICPECEEYVEPVTARECSGCGFQFPEPEIRKVLHERTADMDNAPVYEPQKPSTYVVTDVSYKSKKSKNGNEMIVASYHCGYGKYGTIADFILPYHSNEWVQQKTVQFFKERGVKLNTPLTNYKMDELLFECEHLKKPCRIVVNHSEEFPKIIKYEWPVKQQPIEEYLDDDIPLFIEF